ncbi:Disintegrin family protein [Coccidioides posadasii C735 delta SOWgp]|uniref:Disintegrin and metalloproteinase domain-containing protein B n=2 Tax=Coccidioides posadasii TaxID=199306 RepID=A0A0J6EWQ1_COCPO|nr:Disintegrin family protein [Coccidioides posadasii C735 delta SOWgp]EER23572.1 Disintegrin family protein [Coccidioides posadasii C735 delta SOWgp]KMM64991.1 ADAM-8 protein [Coccidioides posadasii RMSCC 3488]|eukprot:XP_003065717.1 Disintegrin family protein [Coccidioides posadasii C735 delta SOWgp]
MRLPSCLVPVVTSLLSLLSQNVLAHAQRDRINYISLIEDPVINTPSRRVHALSSFDLIFSLHQKNQRIKLSLEPNHDLLGFQPEVHYADNDGQLQQIQSINRYDHKVFKGWASVESESGWERSGWARIVVYDDGPFPLFEGTFTIMHDHHHVLLRSSYMQTRQPSDPALEDTTRDYMIVFRDSDVGRDIHANLKRGSPIERSCGSDSLSFNTDPDHPMFRPVERRDQSSWAAMPLDLMMGISKRQGDISGGNPGGPINIRETIGSTAGCPRTKKVALIGVAADCEYTKSFNSSVQAAQRNIVNVVNSASQIYEEAFNITLGLRKVQVLPGECPATPPASAPWNAACGTRQNSGPDISRRLNLFSAWRGEQNDDNAFWMLMTTCNSGPEVGLAWLGQVCINTASRQSDRDGGPTQSVSSTGVVVRTPQEWQVFAHEAGHIFGAVHDCDSELCASPANVARARCCPLTADSCDADGRFIMNPTSGRGITDFSPCTIGQICTAMGRNIVRTSCFTNNRNVVTYAGSECGNGIVEEGEDCDCGGEEMCANNRCCDPRTCKFRDGAVCDDSNEECCRNCQFASSDTVCRPSTGPCDPEEKCTGRTALCPKDSYKKDGDRCGNGLACASGQCTSRDMQCRVMMGGRLGGNDTESCDFSSCSLSCRSRSSSPEVCVIGMQYFLDGTPCVAGGVCKNGSCTGSSFGNEIRSWIDRNKNLVIGLSAGLGGLLVLAIFGCIFRRCRRPRPKNRKMAPMKVRSVPDMWTSSVPPDQYTRGPPPGPPQNIPPVYPPPAYSQTYGRGDMPSPRYA